MHIEYTNGAPTADMLDHLPPLPLLLEYFIHATIQEQDQLWIHHGLRLHDRVRRIRLILPPSISIWHKVVVLMDKHFPMLEHLSLSFGHAVKNGHPLTLPKAFLAPNLRHIALPNISPPRRLRFLTSTVSLVTLELSDITTSGYFRPRLLVARLGSLPQLIQLSIEFSTPLPRPSTEREMLGEQRAPVTLPSLNRLQFKGVGTYLESLLAQIRAPLLGQLEITLFNQIAFALPHLSYLISITEALQLPGATAQFGHNAVLVSMAYDLGSGYVPCFSLRVLCKPLDWQIDCASQIYHELIPTLSCVDKLSLYFDGKEIPAEFRNGTIDSATWHELLRSFIRVKRLYVDELALLEELSRALQVDEVGSDPGFLPNLRSIYASDNRFTSFIESRQVVGRPVQFIKWSGRAGESTAFNE